MPIDDDKNKELPNLVPRPDPTLLTTQQLMQAIAALKELVFTRLDGMDKAMELFSSNITRVPTDTDKQISHLKSLHEEMFQTTAVRLKSVEDHIERARQERDQQLLSQATLNKEKFDGIQKQFEERDTRQRDSTTQSEKAVATAMQAAEKAGEKQNEAFSLSIDKSERATTKQIDQLQALIQATREDANGKIDDIKERLTRIEGEGRGGVIAKTEQRADLTTQQGSNSIIIAVVVAVIMFIGLVGTLIALVMKTTN